MQSHVPPMKADSAPPGSGVDWERGTTFTLHFPVHRSYQKMDRLINN